MGIFGGPKDVSNKFRSRFWAAAADKNAKTPRKRLHFVYFCSGQTFSRYHGMDQPVKRKATSSRKYSGSFNTDGIHSTDRRDVKRETAARRAAEIFGFSSVFSRFLQYNIIFQNGVGGWVGRNLILYYIAKRDGWVEKSRFFNYVISEWPLMN